MSDANNDDDDDGGDDDDDGCYDYDVIRRDGRAVCCLKINKEKELRGQSVMNEWREREREREIGRGEKLNLKLSTCSWRN